MSKKSNKLYAILVMPVAEKRDKELSGLLDIDYIFNYKGKKFLSRSYYFTSDFLKVKTWKTITGALNFLEKNKKTIKNVSEYLRFEKSDYDPKDWRNPIFEVVEISKDWNEYIDDIIKREQINHNKLIEKYLKYKIL